MNAKEITTAVAAHVLEVGVDNVDTSKLAVQLIRKGASISLVNRVLNKALAAAGVAVKTPVQSEALKFARKQIEKVFTAKKFKAPTSYKELREMGEAIVAAAAEDKAKHELTVEAALKCIRTKMKADKLEIPSKCGVRGVKAAIVEYFVSTAKDEKATATLEGLAKYLQKEAGQSEEKAIHAARMNFAFAQLLFNRQSVNDIN